MKSKPAIIVVMLALAYVAATALLWPYHAALLPGGVQPAENPLVELAGLSMQAPLSLIVEPDDGMTAVTQAVASARTSIDLVVYELEDPALEQELVGARERGVVVRVLLDNLDTFGQHPNQAAFNFLQSEGVPVAWTPGYFPLTHQKTLVVDNHEAFVMTFNFTPKYYASSRDFAVLDTSAADVAAIESAFDADWQGERDTAENGTDLAWSPGSAGILLALIGEASTSLDVYNEEMADPRVVQALERAAARGVDVRVDMTYETAWKSVFEQLTAAGVEVRTYASSAKFYIHAKVIVADGAEAFVGSQNFSPQSLDDNRELGVVLARPDIIASLQTVFEQDWQGSRPF